MQWYEEDIRALEQRLKTGPMPPHPVAFYGSSTITLWSTLACDLALPCALNLGFGGSTLEACAYFFRRIVVPTRPAALVLYAGDNDLGDGRSPEAVLASFRAFAVQIEVPFGFISVKPSPARFGIIDRIRRTNDLIRREIECAEDALFIPLFDAMLDNRGAPRASLFLEDGLHLSREGYRLWSALLPPYLNQIFKRQSAECNCGPIGSGQGEEGVSQVVQPQSEP